MNDRVKNINQKRITLKAQLTKIEKTAEDANLEPANVKMRLDGLKEQFRLYEEFHDELALLVEPDNEQLGVFDALQDRFYKIVTKIETIFPPVTPGPVSGFNTTCPLIGGTRNLKSPVVDLPKFDGDLEKLSFKTTFLTMIDSREDVTNMQKFIYLKNCLGGDALNKTCIYNVSEENYETAWKLLLESYDEILILMVKHLDTILEPPVQTKVTH
ncbi:uncharacterized protein LOC124180664 [Neodiprion fabricii]|uniref:uncharacterized protein LOC124180664 n=1 Tax=Neodiprion fabricii TaxID=2872261 RepID=UPI001ED8F335|nr:uncharacterized protein LOC124180664 [Neodiprion fabricii]